MQFTLHRRTDLAIQALNELNERSAALGGASLAESIGSTTSYLPQVMAPLIKAGWVNSERGPNGGYALAVGLETISLLNLVEAVEGPIANNQCVLRGGPCPGNERCSLHGPWSRIRDSVINQLGANTVVQPDTNRDMENQT